MTTSVLALIGVSIAAVVVAIASAVVAHRRGRELRRLADYDTLTGLPTRRLLGIHLRGALRESHRSTSRVAVLALEVRGFIHLNDAYGREVGDAVMSAVADVLRRATRPEEYLVRFGGPRFVIVCPDVSDRSRAEARAAELVGEVQRPYDLGRDRIRLSVSVGLALTDHHTTSPDEVVLDASVALEQALDAGRGALRTFEASARGALAPSTAERRLREALDRGEFRLHYLPVVRLDDHRLFGVEALLRWADPVHGLVNPTRFLHALDQTGLIIPVGEWVVREAARQSVAWQQAFGDRPIETSINVSPRQLMQADFVDKLAAAVDETGADPARLCLEVTEGAMAHEPDELWATLRQAKLQGFHLALDDLGRGYASLALLRQFKLDRVKIAHSFVSELPHAADDRAIVGHLVALADDLGMVPVAEGIETAAQAAALRDFGCPLGQGFYFSPPQPPDVITAILGGTGSVATADAAGTTTP